MNKNSKNRLLALAEITIVALSIIVLILSCVLAYILPIESELVKILIIIICGIIPTIGTVPFSIILESIAIRFVCKNCGHEHKLNSQDIFLSPHCGLSKYVICPKCNKKCWHKGIIDE